MSKLKSKLPLLLAATTFLSGCASGYQLVPASTVSVAKSGMTVAPSRAWNRVPRLAWDIKEEENWTASGLSLDQIGFIAALPDGQAIVKQRRKADQKVPVFRADMTPQDLTSMLESFYRIRSEVTVFETTSVQPAEFLGGTGLRFDYDYVTADDVKRRGRAVMRVDGGKLYMIALDAARSHYFDAAAPEFDRLVATARRS